MLCNYRKTFPIGIFLPVWQVSVSVEFVNKMVLIWFKKKVILCLLVGVDEVMSKEFESIICYTLTPHVGSFPCTA